MFMIPLAAMFTRTKLSLTQLKTNSLERNASYYLPRKASFFRKETGTKTSQSVQSKKNKTDCGVFTCLFAKHLISEECNYDDIKLDQPRDDMAGDLLNLATAGTHRVQDLPENLQWIFREDANHNESASK